MLFQCHSNVLLSARSTANAIWVGRIGHLQDHQRNNESAVSFIISSGSFDRITPLTITKVIYPYLNVSYKVFSRQKFASAVIRRQQRQIGIAVQQERAGCKDWFETGWVDLAMALATAQDYRACQAIACLMALCTEQGIRPLANTGR